MLNIYKRDTKFLIIGISCIFILYIPFFINGEDTYIRISDVLDTELSWLNVLKLNDQLFTLNSNQKVLNIFNGLPLKYIQSEFDFKRVFFYFLPSFWAYISSSITTRVIAFIGMHLLIKNYLLINNRYYSFIIALSFSLIPCFTIYGLSILGQPIILWSFLNLILNKNVKISYVIIFLFPFYSHIAFGSPFYIFILLIYCIYNILIQKQLCKNFYFGIFILIFSTLIANVSLLILFFSHEKTYRDLSFTFNILPSIPGYFFTFLRTVAFGNIHPSNFIAFSPIVIFLFNKNKNTNYLFLLYILIISLFFTSYGLLTIFFNIKIIKVFNFSRILIFNTFVFYIILIKSVENCNIKKFYIYLILIIQLCVNILSNPEFSYNIPLKTNKEILTYFTDINIPIYKIYNFINPKNKKKINNNNLIIDNNMIKEYDYTYKNFYSVNLFSKVKQYINKPTSEYRVVSIGIPPAIAMYNNMFVLDGDFDTYSGNYYLKFRNIILGEIQKNVGISYKYDYGGAQAFIFVSELFDPYYNNCTKNINKKEINNLSINTKSLSTMGCKYIISALRIENFEYLNLKFEKYFIDDISNYNIYLYSLK